MRVKAMRPDKLSDFNDFLSNRYKSMLTGEGLSSKVISDILGRLRRVEMILKLDIDSYVGDQKTFEMLCGMIKNNFDIIRKNHGKSMYGYNKYIYAARLYYKHKMNNEIFHYSKDGRINVHR